ncbi:MAG: ATP-NAD kinase family protein [Oceanicoccus sp.]
MFKLGLIVNPFAGIGGPLGLKGSDGELIVNRAKREGAVLQSSLRASKALVAIQSYKNVEVFGFAGDMGENAAADAGLRFHVIGSASSRESTANDTIVAAKTLKAQGVDLILFAGGDGTARDVFRAVGSDIPVLGVPAGVKMHSGVYAVSPHGAGQILEGLIKGELIDLGLAEVRDIDEDEVRKGVVRSRYYGELLVPQEGRFLQHVKSSGREVEALVLQDIAADVIEEMEEGTLYIIGPGTTPRGIMNELGLDNTLLGVDAVVNSTLVGSDLNECALRSLIARHNGPVKLIITAIGGQGHIFGRGNQQLSSAVIKDIGIENIVIVATKTKISELGGRPLLVDSNDEEIDEGLSGYRKIVTGYHDAIMYPVGLHNVEEPIK